MKKKSIVLIMMIALMFVGCAGKAAIKWSETDIQNVEDMRVVARNLLTTWSMWSGIIKGALGPHMSMLPKQTVDALNELDFLAAIDIDKITDEQLGRSLGVRARMLMPIVMEALKMVAPDILDILPMILIG